MEEPIIEPVSKELLKSELTPERQLRMTNKSNNEIYIITAHNAPNVMREIGRLREIAFREAGGGTGKPMDIDEFDTCANCYKQLIVWNPEAEEIIGGYRYLLGTDWELDENRQPKLATSHMFHFSDKFIDDYMPYTIELGRSFVTLEYQSTRRGAKSLFALDNLWDGLGALTVIKPNVKYFFGKMTMYPSYIRRGRDMILYFLKKHFDDKDDLILPLHPLKIETPEEELAALFCEDDFKKDYPHTQPRDSCAGLQHPAARERLHVALAHHEALRHRHQLRLRRRRGDGHPHRRGRDSRKQACAPYRLVHQGAPRSAQDHQRRQQRHLQRTRIGGYSIPAYPTQPAAAMYSHRIRRIHRIF